MSISISLPKFDISIEIPVKSCGLKDYMSLKEYKYFMLFGDVLERVPRKVGGVYFLYSNSDLLYVGRSNNVHRRIADHLSGITNTATFIHSCSKIDIILVDDVCSQEIYETYSIKEFNPLFNRGKRDKCNTDKQLDKYTFNDEIEKISTEWRLPGVHARTVPVESINSAKDLKKFWKGSYRFLLDGPFPIDDTSKTRFTRIKYFEDFDGMELAFKNYDTRYPVLNEIGNRSSDGNEAV